ncbi:hydroxymethylpyrimidine/phosphomethylpyrimidine kinase [Massilia sp. CF038]|uniref:bifunctional hydroxymethylpyrimidine kinase/phosphomethylpyrimidine kinase n=1 Tax=Massilia sp. CF038 TaxID=1881045 RepID=UPI00090F62A2|nr:hydroxymethylpyrimidine/phosphomethylpyrimidine kinase [Massilia sp. CF038]SHH27988.1 hydroxymethylpyrimidine/phosphomethylpyrimidine kinase [Massilia sp. CF038]
MMRTVLVLSGLDPSGGAGMAADLLAIAAQGVHALPVITALTVQDHNRVHGVEPVDPGLLRRQAQALIDTVGIDAVKIGIPGSRANAWAIAQVIVQLRERAPQLQVVLDPVLASGHGDTLTKGDARAALQPLLPLATLVVPNLGEAEALDLAQCRHVLTTGGHGTGAEVVNRWRGADVQREWRWPRLAGQFHGSGCTLAAAIAARLALGEPMATALERAQSYVHQSLAQAFSIGPGQRIPRRHLQT